MVWHLPGGLVSPAGHVDEGMCAQWRAAVTIGLRRRPRADFRQGRTDGLPLIRPPLDAASLDLRRRGATRRPETAGSGEATLRCIALVGLVTAYLDGELDANAGTCQPALRRCAGCVQYVEQMRVTACTVGKIRDKQLDPAFRDRLLDAFRDWN